MKEVDYLEEENKKASGSVIWFPKVDKNSISLTGVKGSKLGELFTNRFPVPEGFVITSDSYTDFLKSSGLYNKIKNILDGISLDDKSSIEYASIQIKGMIEKAELPEGLKEDIVDSYSALGTSKVEIEKGSAYDILNNASEPIFVSVRSSLCFKSSRMDKREQDTYLNVKGNEEVLDHIKKIYSSLFNSETLKREFKRVGFENLKIAVIIQKMVDSEKSGYSVSRDHAGNISISSIWGNGEGFNLKEIIPDKAVLSRGLEVIEIKTGEKPFYVKRDSSGSLKKIKSGDERKISPVLSEYEMKRIADFSEKIESHFQVPQRIDFEISDSQIYVVDSIDLNSSRIENKAALEKDEEIIHVYEPERKVHDVGRVEKVTKTRIKLVLNSPHFIEEAQKTALKKIGIFKIEKIIENSGKHPLYFLRSNYIGEYESLIYNGIKNVSKNFEEIWLRTSDFTSDLFSRLEGSPALGRPEKNPLMGLHGVRLGLKYPEILEAELNAFKKISEETNVGVLIPNLISIQEFQTVKEILKKIHAKKLKLGVIIETPAAMQIIKELCLGGVDLVFINVDTLSENLLSVDSSNHDVKELLDYMHPSIVYQLEYLIRVARRNNVETDIFGDGLKNKEFLQYVLHKGIDFVSVYPEEAKEMSETIYSIEKDLPNVKDSDPRKYELEKMKDDYIKVEEDISSEKKKDKVHKKKEKGMDVLGIF